MWCLVVDRQRHPTRCDDDAIREKTVTTSYLNGIEGEGDKNADVRRDEEGDDNEVREKAATTTTR